MLCLLWWYLLQLKYLICRTGQLHWHLLLVLFTGSFYIVDNWHQFIMLVLISFGTGHIILKARFGIITLSLLAVFFFLIYTQFHSDRSRVIAVSAFVAGMIYAKDVIHFDFVEDVLYRLKALFSFNRFFGRKPKQSCYSQQQSQKENAKQQWQAEQARREQEAQTQRQQKSYQSEPKSEKKSKEAPKQEQAKNSHYQKKKESIEENKPTADTRSNLDILGLKPGFTQEDLKKAYRRERARCHPDKWVGKPAHIQKTMEEEQKLVNKAYNELKS